MTSPPTGSMTISTSLTWSSNHVLASLEAGVLVQRLPGGERAERDGGGLPMAEGEWLSGHIGGGHRYVFGGGTGPVKPDQRVDLVPSPPAGPGPSSAARCT
jgi:hypothetical protein